MLGTYLRGNDTSVGDAVCEILKFRESYGNYDFATQVSNIEFAEDIAEDGSPLHLMVVTLPNKKGKRSLQIMGSGTKSLCTIFGLPHRLLSKMSSSTIRMVFEDLLESKFNDPKKFVTLRCGKDVGGKVDVFRSMVTYRNLPTDDKDVFPAVADKIPNEFVAKDYWADDYISALRVVAKERFGDLDSGLSCRIGFDVSNSEVRDRSLEIRGVVAFVDGDERFDFIVPRRVFGSSQATHFGSVKACASEVAVLVAKILDSVESRKMLEFVDALQKSRVDIGKELTEFVERKFIRPFELLDIVSKCLPEYDLKNIRHLETHEQLRKLRGNQISRFEILKTLAMYGGQGGQDFDSYFRQANMEFVANLRA